MPSRLLERRGVHVAALVTVAIAAVGFLTGTRRAPSLEGYHRHGRAVDHEVPAAPRYGEVGRVRHAARGLSQAKALAALRPGAPPSERPPATADERAAALAARQERRAYDGAPPSIPHPIDHAGYPACLSCHAEGLRLETRSAARVSHELMANCLQCHAAEAPRVPQLELAGGPAEGTTFVGLESVAAIARPWPTAPPVIPHTTSMRTECASCHGALGTGIHTTHPARQSCTQCHALSAAMDQRPRGDSTDVPTPARAMPNTVSNLGPGGAAP